MRKRQFQKKKERERRVAQKKLVEAKKRAEIAETTQTEAPGGYPLGNKIAASVSGRRELPNAPVPKPIIHRRSGG